MTTIRKSRSLFLTELEKLLDGTYDTGATLFTQATNGMLVACEGALAALSQSKTFPADIEAAKGFLRTAIAEATGEPS